MLTCWSRVGFGMMGFQEYQGGKANGKDDYMCVKIKAEVCSRSRDDARLHPQVPRLPNIRFQTMRLSVV